MKKHTLLIALTAALLLLSVALLLVACGSVKGTYYEVNGDELNESSWIKLQGGKWTDDEDASGTYKTSGNNITFFVDGEELCSGTAKDGTLELKMFGESLGIFRTKKAQEKYIKHTKQQQTAEEPSTYTITLDPGVGTLNSENTVTVEDDSFYNLPIPTRFAYTFTGWYLGNSQVTNAEGESIRNWSFTSDQTFTARWEQTRYLIYANELIDGTSVDSLSDTYYYGDSVTITATEGGPGYTWLGWFDGDTKISEGANLTYTFTMPAQNVSHTAKWITCPITLAKNIEAAGRVGGIEGQTSAGESTTITAKAYAGYVWEGWFDGNTKVSEGASLTYTFNMPTERKTYTAKFAECTDHTFEESCVCTKCNAVAHTPDANGYCEKCGFKREGNYVYFGSYPQTVKANDVEITSTTDARGYYLGSDGEYYAQVTAAPYRSNYTFSSGATIVNNTTYYFKVEPIKWRILSESNGEAFIFCDLVLDAHSYNSLADTSQFYHNGGTGYSNNYALSDIRNWLNSTFYSSVFTTLQKQLVILTSVDNSKDSTLMYNTTGSNDYACEDTEDYVFLLSEREVTTPNYGFKSSNTTSNDLERKKFGTDYSMARGVYYTSDKYGSWWLRSPNSKTEAYIVNYYGYAHAGATVDQIKYGIVPAIKIKL